MKESFLPKKAFAGSNKNKLGSAGQARGEPKRSQKAPLTGLMVGEADRTPVSTTYVIYVNDKPVSKYSDLKRAREDTQFLKQKFPDSDIKLKQHSESNSKDLDEASKKLKCWKGYHRVKGIKAGKPGSCAKNESVEFIKEDKEKFSQFYPDAGDADFNPEDPTVLILGIGTISFSRLKSKATRECEMLLDELKSGQYTQAAHHADQFYRTVKSLGESIKSLEDYNQAHQMTKKFFKKDESIHREKTVPINEAWEQELSRLIQKLSRK